MAKYIMGIDQGTTGTTVIIFDRDANIISSSYSEFTQYFPQDGWVEHDAMEIYEVTKRVCKDALDAGKLTTDNIEAIGITNQRVTTTFWNKNTGVPIRKSIVWQDRRSLPICERLLALDKKGIEERTGMVIIPNASATKIAWLLENDPEVRAGVDKGELLFGTIDTWLIWKLSGGAAHVTDLSNATGTLMLNAYSLDYDDFILNELKIPREILPELRSSSEVYAHTDPKEFFGASIPIAGIAGDQQAATFGQACVKPGMAKNTYGTGAFLLFNCGNTYIPSKRSMMAPVLWKLNDGSVSYGFEGLIDVSGAAIQWLRDGLGIIEKSSDSEKLAREVENSGGVYFVPAFVGLGAPHFDSYARGTMFGITRSTTKQHLCRAALESMAYQVRDAFNMIESDVGRPLNTLRVDGGGAKNDLMLQFQADILGIPVERPVVSETTVLGAAYLAGLAVGYWTSLDDISSNWRIDKRFEPQMPEDKREELYDGWKNAVKRSGGWLKK